MGAELAMSEDTLAQEGPTAYEFGIGVEARR
jgi:hypothetical protein